ncbi:MAG: ImpA family type VI secretion system protein [Parashewanella sp.]
MFTKNTYKTLIQPINEKSFCGYYLKGDKAAFRQLRNGFNLAQTSLRKLSQNPDSAELENLQNENTNNWGTLSNDLVDVFKGSSRDVELIGWFSAAQLFLDPSIESFAMCLEWFAFLVDEHWDELNPVLPEDKLKTETESERLTEQAKAKLKAFFQLLGDSEESSLLYAPILMLPLVADVSFFHYQSAEKRGEAGQIQQHTLQQAAQERDLITTKMENLNRATAAIDKLAVSAAKHCQAVGVSSPNFNFVKGLVAKVSKAIEYLTGIKLADTATAQLDNESGLPQASEGRHNEETSTETGLGQPAEMGQQMLISSAPNLSQTAAMNSMNRTIALHQLREISDYFRQSEPHSPVSFLIEKAIRWGGMSLPNLLKEMMEEPEDGLLNKIFNVAGLDHCDQVMLPEISQQTPHTQTVLKTSNTTANSSLLTGNTKAVEAKVSDVRKADAPLNQKPSNVNSTESTALSW